MNITQRKHRIPVALSVALFAATASAEWTITEVPADTSNIKVATETLTQGVNLFRGLVGYWGFDNPDSPLDRSLGSGSFAAHGVRPAFVTDEKVLGEGALRFGASQALKLSSLPAAMTAGKSFTVAFWHKTGPAASNKGFLMGIYAPEWLVFRLQYNGRFNEMKFNDTSVSVPSAFENKWTHFAVTFQYGASSLVYTLYTNGVSAVSNNNMLNVPADSTIYLGNNNATGADDSRYISDGHFDEFAVFSSALNAGQIKWLMNNSYPLDFSATWEIESAGDLTVPGGCVQDFRGQGKISSLFGLTFSSAVDRSFSGSIGGPSLTLSSANRAKLTLSGANAYSGATKVSGGTLAVSPEGGASGFRAAVLRNRFGDDLSGYWPFDDTSSLAAMVADWSGNGNKLTGSGSSAYVEPSPDEAAVGGAAHFKGENVTAPKWSLKPNAALAGFVSGADNPYAVSMWVKVGADCTTAGSGFWKISDGTTETGIRIRTEKNSGSNYIVAGDTGNYLGGDNPLPLGGAETGLVGGGWHHFVQSYDTGTKKTSVYFDGQLFAEGSSASAKHFGDSLEFSVGLGVQDRGDFKGWMDEIVVLHRSVTAEDVAFLYNHRHSIPASDTGVLPASTTLDVADGAFCRFEAANEQIAGLTGLGGIDLDVSSRLSVVGVVEYKGTISGAGKLALGSDLVWNVPLDGNGRAVPGSYAFFTAPTALLRDCATDGWTVSGQGKRTVSFSVRDNGDGTATLVAKVVAPGMMLIFR